VFDRTEVVAKINSLQISKTHIAALAGCEPSRVSQFVRYRKLPGDQERRITDAVNDINFLWRTLSPYKIETSDPALVRRAVAELKRVLLGLGGTQAPLASLAVRGLSQDGER
jgi:hypothetical protein